MPSISILLNGAPRVVPASATVTTLLAGLGLDPRTVVVEVNREIIRRPRLDKVRLTEGDQVEVVHFVGGG